MLAPGVGVEEAHGARATAKAKCTFARWRRIMGGVNELARELRVVCLELEDY